MNTTNSSAILSDVVNDYDYDIAANFDYSEVFGDDGKIQTTILDELVKLLPCLKDLGINIDSLPPEAMGAVETLMNNSWKFLRMSDDLHSLTQYLNDIRICFIVVTISSYIGILLYLLVMCVRKTSSNSSSRRRRRPIDYEPSHPHWELDSVKSDGYGPPRPLDKQNSGPAPFRQHRMAATLANQSLDSNGGQNMPLLGHPRRTMMAQLSLDNQSPGIQSPCLPNPTTNTDPGPIIKDDPVDKPVV